MKISIISTCKSRLGHLKLVIDSWIAFQPHEIIVVDVSCPDQTREWLNANHPQVKVVYHPSEGFKLSEARNLGAAAATGDWLFFVDADVMLGSGFSVWIKDHMPKNAFLVRLQKSAWDGVHEQGTVLCGKSEFLKVGGYDEVIEGYGGEDHDLYSRLNRMGVKRFNAPQHFINSLEHSDEERMRHYLLKDKKVQSVHSRVYRAAKEYLLSNNPGITELPTSVRKDIWTKCQDVYGNEYDIMSENAGIQLKMANNKWLPEPYILSCELTVRLRVRKK